MAVFVKRFYVVRTHDGQLWQGATLAEAMKYAGPFVADEKFSYRIYEGGNSVECVSLGGKKWRERGKAKSAA